MVITMHCLQVFVSSPVSILDTGMFIYECVVHNMG